MSISDTAAWDLTRDFISKTIGDAKNKMSLDAFISLGLDPHLANCVEWLKKLDENPSPAVLISTYGHDIDRAMDNRVRRENYKNFQDYKKAHAEHSARILCDHLGKISAEMPLINDVSWLVRFHDTLSEWAGKTSERTLGLVLVKSADGLSFFDVNFDYYLQRESQGDLIKVKGKMSFMYEKMCGRTYEEMKVRAPRKITSGVQLNICDRIYEIQSRSEEMVIPYYEAAKIKLDKRMNDDDPKGDTKIRIKPS